MVIPLRSARVHQLRRSWCRRHRKLGVNTDPKVEVGLLTECEFKFPMFEASCATRGHRYDVV